MIEAANPDGFGMKCFKLKKTVKNKRTVRKIVKYLAPDVFTEAYPQRYSF
jgi:hypothetical protein